MLMKLPIIALLGAAMFLAGLSNAIADEVVRSVQAQLQKAGFYEGSIDGTWGSQTAAGVRRYQLANDLRVTGELNEVTLNRMGIAPAVPQYKALAALFKGGPYLTAPPDFQVATIRKAKENLKLLGYYNGPINGDPSPVLTRALEAYQRSAKFRASGRLDKTTLQALNLLTVSGGAY
jgi:peptidoglycan hydrolase-like protein with peptidoglycan-binding domain